MKKNKVNKIFIYWLWACVALVGTSLILGASILIRIYHVPLNLKDLPQEVSKSIQAIAPQYRVSLNDAMLTWKGLGHPIFIDAKNVNIQDLHRRNLKVVLPELKVSFSLPLLLVGNFSIRTLEIIKPSLRFIYEDNSSLAPSSEVDDQFILTILEDFLNHKQHWKRVKHLKIVEANVKIEDLRGEGLFSIPSLTFMVERVNKMQKFHCLGGTEKNHFQLKGTCDFKAGEIFVDANINSNYSVKEDLQQNQKVKTVIPKNQEDQFFSGLKLPFYITSKIHYSKKEGLKEASIILKLDKGKIEIPSLFQHSIDIYKGDIEAIYSHNHFQLKKFRIQSGDAFIRGTAEGIWDKLTRAFTLQSKAETENVMLNDLSKFWPKNLAKTSRQWVIQNITQGKVPKATLKLDSMISLENKKTTFTLKNLNGTIKIQDATVSYLDGMPKVTHVRGEARYSSKDFLIAIDSGRIHQLLLKKGRVDIQNLDNVDQDIDIWLSLYGSLSHHLSLIDYKPLKYAEQFGLKPSQTFGEAETEVHLKFPLLTTITVNDIQADINSKLLNARFIDILAALPFELERGNFALKVNNKNLLFEGVGYVSKVPLKIIWQRNFISNADFQTKLAVTGVINEQVFKDGQTNWIQSFGGTAPFEINYLSKENAHGVLSAKVDLTNAHARILGWEKMGMTRGSLETSMTIRNGIPYKLNFIKAKVTDGIHIEGKGAFDDKGLTELTFPNFKVGYTNVHFSLLRQQNNAYLVKLWGKTLNLEPFLQDFLHTSKNQLESSFELNANINDVVLGVDRTIYNSELNMHYNKNIINQLNFRAGLSKKYPQAILEINLAYEDVHTRKIKLKTNYGGKFLKIFQIYDNVYEGDLNIIATHDDRLPHEPWQGKLVMKDFSLKKAPIFGKLLSLAFPTGVVDLFSEKGMSFSQFRSKFSANTNKIVLTKGRANGASLGLTFAGSVDLQKNNLQIHGSIIPAYYLNTILSKIPIIGELASGGKHEGLFSVSYTITGDSNKPEISVNPVSIFTPGFFRKIFEPEIDEEFEDSDDEFKELND